MMDAGRHPRIQLETLTEVIDLEGQAGAFRARLRRSPRFVDEDLCVGCGACSEACPAVRPNPYDVGLKAAKAIDRPFPQAVPAAYHIDTDSCLNEDLIVCERCARACEPKAIDFEERPRERSVDVGSVIIATGFDELDPHDLLPLGYGRAENVLTGLEFERLLCATGPTRGRVLRPSDHRVPERIVFVQCVGSRGEGGRSYCSRYCCMNAVKAARLAHEHEPDIKQSFLLYSDMRAAGRGYDAFVERSLTLEQIRPMRGRPAKLAEDPESRDLTLWVEDFANGRPRRLSAGMVVLSTAALPSRGTAELARTLGVELDDQGFVRRLDPEGQPAATTRPGVYVAGSAGRPVIIPECVAQGAAAAAEASVHVLGSRQPPETAHREAEIDPSGPPRVGVFVCHCGANIAGVVDVARLRDEAARLPEVVYATDLAFSCADISLREIEAAIAEHRLNRVVVAACTPRTHEPVFRETLARAGLNPYLLEMVNIRDQCTWVHAHVPDEAQLRARDQLRMGVRRAARLEPLEPIEVPVTRRALVIGGGMAGMRAALDLDALGYETHLVERTGLLGGHLVDPGLKTLYTTGEDCETKLAQMTAAIESSGVEIWLHADVMAVEGYVGNFTVTLRTMQDRGWHEQLEIGSLVVAVGGQVYEPQSDFGYGDCPNVITGLELEHYLVDPRHTSGSLVRKPPKDVVFIQCVGSRSLATGANPGCSRYCCPTTVKQSLALAERGVRVTVFYRDMRCVSPGAEELYRKARGAGVVFVRTPEDAIPEVIGRGKARSVRAPDLSLGRTVEARADLVVLATGMVPDQGSVEALREILKLPVGPDGFFMERHPELAPVETVIDGVVVCGAASGAKAIADSLSEAGAAASAAARIMARETLELEPTVAAVDPIRCRGCGRCVELCEFHAPSLTDGALGVPIAQINEAACKGCGTCVAWCPTGAIRARHFTDAQIDSMLETVLSWPSA
jgi:heterodisulfide reductase subunit A